MQEHRIQFKYTHSLILLLDLCLSQDKRFDVLREDLVHLESYATATRYPGGSVSLEMAEEGFAVVERIRKFVRHVLKME